MLLPLPGPRHIQRCGRRVSGKSNGAYCAYRRKLQRYDICTTGQLTSSSPEIGNFYARCKHTLGIGNIPGRGLSENSVQLQKGNLRK
ncbi:hypothetical protein Mapa_004105 [Marchantia paleacea]|nr:hypothetical protein Mapa_004105 [Marchantia paleacea]